MTIEPPKKNEITSDLKKHVAEELIKIKTAKDASEQKEVDKKLEQLKRKVEEMVKKGKSAAVAGMVGDFMPSSLGIVAGPSQIIGRILAEDVQTEEDIKRATEELRRMEDMQKKLESLQKEGKPLQNPPNDKKPADSNNSKEFLSPLPTPPKPVPNRPDRLPD